MSQTKLNSKNTVIYADGACLGNPGTGGWGVIIATPDGNVKELGGAESSTTNNRMELFAVSEALSWALSHSGSGTAIQVFLDSQYVLQGVQDHLPKWKSRGWIKADGKPVAHEDLWKVIDSTLTQAKGHKLSWNYVPGHQGIPGNERVDAIANGFAQDGHFDLFEGAHSKYVQQIEFDPMVLPEAEELTKKSEPAYYLSYVDQKLEKHATWKECEARVKGRAGAKFKKVFGAKDEERIKKSWGLR